MPRLTMLLLDERIHSNITYVVVDIWLNRLQVLFKKEKREMMDLIGKGERKERKKDGGEKLGKKIRRRKMWWNLIQYNRYHCNLLFGALYNWFVVIQWKSHETKQGDAEEAMCTQLFISHEFFTLCKGENEKRLKGEKVGHGQTNRWKDEHLCEKSIFVN